MKINSIFFLLLMMGIMLVIPKTRRWIMQNVLNNTLLRRNVIRIGMSIPMIRKRVVKEAMQGLH